METIIQQKTEQLMQSWIRIISEKGLSEIESTCKSLLEENKRVVLDLLSALISELDDFVYADKTLRKELGLSVRERSRSRSYLTHLGYLTYKRTYYHDKSNDKYIYPVDVMIGVSGYERISSEVCADLVQRSSDRSMRKSALDVVNGEVSGQSVCNKVHGVGVLEIDLPESQREISELHIFADEDHVSLQNGKTKNVPLVTVCEGIRSVGKNRRRLINPIHFTSRIEDVDKLWRKAYAYSECAYNLNDVENIYIHGDGAKWIQKGCEEFASSIFVLDGFHLKKRLKPFLTDEYSDCIRVLIQSNRKDDFGKVTNSIISDCKDAVKKKLLKENSKYLLNNWDAVVNRFNHITVGSCTEALISHVLSERLSRNPMAWSEDGASAMAMLRTFTKNGLRVRKQHFKRSNEEKTYSDLSKYADKIIDECVNAKIDLSLLEREKSYNSGKITPISIVMKSLGSIKKTGSYKAN